MGRSIVNYVLANPQARITVKSTKVWGAGWVAVSGHRVISCDAGYDIHLHGLILLPPNSISRSSQCVRKIKSSNLSNTETEGVVRWQFCQ